jgi:hypothetical protein
MVGSNYFGQPYFGQNYPEYGTGELNCTLYAVEQQDFADFQLVAEEEEVLGGWGEFIPWRLPVLSARLYAVEPQDTARFSLAFDYTDDDLVLMMMSAAWDDENQFMVQSSGFGVETTGRGRR